MAEFDSSAFSAIDSFFVIDRNSADDEKNNGSDKQSQKAPSGKERRLGVGATVPAKTEPSSAANDAGSKVLNVGRKKKRGRSGDESEEEEHDANGDDDDEEEEIGRTGIVSEREKIQEQVGETENKSSKKKKKKGKKERQQEKDTEEEEDEGSVPKVLTEDNPENVEAVQDGEGSTGKKSMNNDQNGGNDDSQSNNNNNNNNNSSKNRRKKRRKVRSRQKNIYKDTRLPHEKPDHLVPGGFEYKGRPITTATKTKLVSKHILPAAGGDDPFLHHTSSSSPTEKNTEGMMEDVGASVGVEVQSSPSIPSGGSHNIKQKKNRRGQRKYKNLQ